MARASANGTWRRIYTANTPGTLYTPAFAYDSYGKRMLLFGGYLSGTPKNDVWQLNLDCDAPNWTTVTALGTKPAARNGSAGIYDRAHNQLVINGGIDTDYFGDTWRLSLDSTPTWALLNNQTGSTTCHNAIYCRREGHSAVYSTYSDKLWIFAGEGCLQFNSSAAGTMTSSSLSWANSGAVECGEYYYDDHLPETRSGHSEIYDTRSHLAFILGGAYDSPGPANCWVSSSSGGYPWTQLTSPPDAQERDHHAAVYDSLRYRMLVVGGNSSDDSVIALSIPTTYPTSGTPSWSTLTPSGTKPSLTALASPVAIFDPIGDRTILFGADGNTYELDFDNAPPTTISDLEIKSTGNAKAYIRWSAPSDELGRAKCYDVRYSSTEITESNFVSATKWASPPTPSAPSAKDSVQITGLTNGTTYYFAVKSVDSTGVWSAMSNVVYTTPCAPGGCPESMVPAQEEMGRSVVFSLDRITPTPSNGTLRVAFRLPASESAWLDLVDVAGRTIRKVEVGTLGPGQHEVDLSSGARLPAGFYFVRLRQGERLTSRSAIVVR